MGDAVCKISPTLLTRQGLGMGGVHRRGRSASLGSWGELRCPLRGKASGSSSIQGQGHPQKADFSGPEPGPEMLETEGRSTSGVDDDRRRRGSSRCGLGNVPRLGSLAAPSAHTFPYQKASACVPRLLPEVTTLSRPERDGWREAAKPLFVSVPSTDPAEITSFPHPTPEQVNRLQTKPTLDGREKNVFEKIPSSVRVIRPRVPQPTKNCDSQAPAPG